MQPWISCLRVLCGSLSRAPFQGGRLQNIPRHRLKLIQTWSATLEPALQRTTRRVNVTPEGAAARTRRTSIADLDEMDEVAAHARAQPRAAFAWTLARCWPT
jgi:hypothetical protein